MTALFIMRNPLIDTCLGTLRGKIWVTSMRPWRQTGHCHSSAEGVALAGGEIGERHLVSATDFRIQAMNLAGEPVRW